MANTEIRTYKGVKYEVNEGHHQFTMNFGFYQRSYSCVINGNVRVYDTEAKIKSFISRQIQLGKATTNDIVKTLRTNDTTKICKLYKRIFGEVPTKESCVYANGEKLTYKHLDGFAMYQWAKDYASSKKMDRALYVNLDRASHKWKYSCYDEPYRHSPHGIYKPLQKQHIVEELIKNCENPTSPYAKRPIYGHTHLYFCSPIFAHDDYNKWQAIAIKGNERFCELVVKYADKFFKE